MCCRAALTRVIARVFGREGGEIEKQVSAGEIVGRGWRGERAEMKVGEK